MENEGSMLYQLLIRGDVVQIKLGRLCIRPKSGKSIPQDWMDKNHDRIVWEISRLIGLTIYRYQSYSTGRYGKNRAEGVNLRFRALDGSDNYAIFNAYLTRARTTQNGKAGSPLPPGQFRVGESSLLFKFWTRTNLPQPKRPLSSLYDYMGNLKQLLFVGEPDPGGAQGRLDKNTIQPLSVSHEQLLGCIKAPDLADNSRTSAGQLADNCQTRTPDKETSPSQTIQRVQPKSTTCHSGYDTRLQGGAGIRGEVIPFRNDKMPEEQTDDEWLADYERLD